MSPPTEIPVEKLSDMPALKVLNVQSNPLDSNSRSALQSAHRFDTLSSPESWDFTLCCFLEHDCILRAVCILRLQLDASTCLGYIHTADSFSPNLIFFFLDLMWIRSVFFHFQMWFKITSWSVFLMQPQPADTSIVSQSMPLNINACCNSRLEGIANKNKHHGLWHPEV